MGSLDFAEKTLERIGGLAIWPLAGLGTEEWHGGRILAGSLAGGEGKYGEEKEGTEEYLLEVLVGLGWTEAAALRSRGSGGRPGRRSVTIPATRITSDGGKWWRIIKEARDTCVCPWLGLGMAEVGALRGAIAPARCGHDSRELR